MKVTRQTYGKATPEHSSYVYDLSAAKVGESNDLIRQHRCLINEESGDVAPKELKCFLLFAKGCCSSRGTC